MKRTIILTILDGWGIGRSEESNPIHVVNPQNINYLKYNFLSGALQASGISVGLPWGEEGNSEVGHLNIGAGAIIYQHYPKITLAIRDGSFFKNETIKKAFEHAKKNKGAMNIVGLLSEGNVHSSLEHLKAFIQFAEQENFPKINLHLFTDGRDSPPFSALSLLSQIPRNKLASLSGRFYAMDRDGHWERTEKVYNTLIGKDATMITDIEAHLKETYDRKFNDEYIEPVLVGPVSADPATSKPEPKIIQDNDAVIFFNFRNDRMRQITSAFIKGFNPFPVKDFSNLYVVTLTEYDKIFNFPIAFPETKIENPLGKVLSDSGKTQFRIAETQKYPHITYFFNGLREEPFKNEYRVLIPSNAVFHQEENPEMRAAEITNRILEALDEKVYDFMLINYANPDMIAHTGNYQACLEAVKVVDEQIGKLAKAALDHNDILIITSDHGNMERVFNPLTGESETHHDSSPVPIYIVAKEFERKKDEYDVNQSEKTTAGILADIAPTILELMGLPKPKEMTGESLLRILVSDY